MMSSIFEETGDQKLAAIYPQTNSDCLEECSDGGSVQTTKNFTEAYYCHMLELILWILDETCRKLLYCSTEYLCTDEDLGMGHFVLNTTVFTAPSDLHGLKRSVDVDIETNKGDKFERMLRALHCDKILLKNVVQFALDNAGVESAALITDIMARSFLAKDTSMRMMMANLTLLSNILSTGNDVYKNFFSILLPHIMLVLHYDYCGIGGALVAEVLKERILKMMHDWGTWSLYSSEYLNDLRHIFLHGHPMVMDTDTIEKNANCEDTGSGYASKTYGGLATG
ncbi:hypothetical protein ACP70R_048731 [Stipagrostis hirtigluma subsp. patula]